MKVNNKCLVSMRLEFEITVMSVGITYGSEAQIRLDPVADLDESGVRECVCVCARCVYRTDY